MPNVSAETTIEARLRRLCALSPCFSRLLDRLDDSERRELLQTPETARLPRSDDWLPPLHDGAPLEMCMRHLRHHKARGLAHLIWWEFALHGDVRQAWRATSALADALIQEALRMARWLIAPRFGGVPGAGFCVIGLGKLGGDELNLGSDVDLLFLWRGEGNSEGGRRSLPVAEYHARLARLLIRLLDEPTAEGRVWPVDMRLRPGGASFPIALPLSATLEHYLEHGQTWERAMLLKARPVAGDMALGADFLQNLRPFKFRRYLDYTTLNALREMKRRIDGAQRSAEPTAGFDVKRGRGGIREIEFIAQSLQLLHGGRMPALQALRDTEEVLRFLCEARLMPEEDAAALRRAYRFWRHIEHALQARAGEQTQRIPADYGQWLAQLTGHDALDARMREIALDVRRLFDAHLPSSERHPAFDWLHAQDPPSSLPEAQWQAIQACMRRIREHLRRGLLPERAEAQLVRILHDLMPIWLDDANGLQALDAFADLVRNIGGRATWIDLLDMHRGARRWLAGVLSASRYLAAQIARNPSWLEWPLQQERGAIDIQRLCATLHALDPRKLDDDHFLAELGRLVDQARLHCALAIDAHEASPPRIGAWLADAADAATEAVIRLSLRRLRLPENFPLVALAMGKHGSREMGLRSDLDMVFVLVADDEFRAWEGRSLRDWAQRLGRRVIQALSEKPPFGAGYQIDARLRPSGRSGVLVTSLRAFTDYQRTQAQTWEHQALCRARPVAGPADARARLQAVVDEILRAPREPARLRADIANMRAKMLRHLASRDEGCINLKHDPGGLVDIEFLAQFSRLAHGGGYVGTMDTLRDPPSGAPEDWAADATIAAEAYLRYREIENALQVELSQSIDAIPTDPSASAWRTLQRHCRLRDISALRQRMKTVREIFQRWIFG